MEGERRMWSLAVENVNGVKGYLSVYAPEVSSMLLHTFVLGLGVARRALVIISTPPFRTGGAGKHAPQRILCTA
jgi:hypothetical protein